MGTEIFYFTATGNSLAAARDIAGILSGTLISIPSVIVKERIQTGAGVIGIVFPVYYASFGGSGIPLIIKRFVGKLEGLDTKRIFAVCTHGGMPGDTIKNLGEVIEAEGGELSAGFEARMSIPYSAGDKVKHILLRKELRVDSIAEREMRQKLFAGWTRKLDSIQRRVSVRDSGRLKANSGIIKAILAPCKCSICRRPFLDIDPFQVHLADLSMNSFHWRTGASYQKRHAMAAGFAQGFVR